MCELLKEFIELPMNQQENKRYLSPDAAGNTVYSVKSVNWRGSYLKRLHLEPGEKFIDVPLSACVSSGDSVRVSEGEGWVICRNGQCKFLYPYTVPDVVRLGNIDVSILVKEITEPEEQLAYSTLANYHYRGQSIHGRTARLIIRTFHPSYPKIIGYVELATPFFVNKPRSIVLDAPFKCGEISWIHWDMSTLRKYIHLVVRIARTVVAPEFRGSGVGQILVKHAIAFSKSRWQVAGYLPYFLEISADMLKFVPFAEKAGMVYVGDTEGNLKRVAKDMQYLIGRFGKDDQDKTRFAEISGILDQQIARMDRLVKLAEKEHIDINSLISQLDKLSKRNVLRQFNLFHGIVSLPKPHYMIGINPEAAEFLQKRVKELNISNGNSPPDLSISRLTDSIRLQNANLTYLSQVRRTFKTHAVQQAFDISPESVNSTVIRELDLTIDPGDIVLVLGPSGSGKSTLLETLAGVKTCAAKISPKEGIMLPSNYTPATFKPIVSKKPLIELVGGRDVRSSLYILGLAGLSEPVLYMKRFQELSRGQQYRAMLARLITSGANVWVADEFCTNLDPATANLVAYKVQKLARQLGVTLIAAAPDCHNFLHSLKPDTVVLLSSNWDHSVMSGSDYLHVFSDTFGLDGKLPNLRVFPEMITAILEGKKSTTIRKGRRPFNTGLLCLTDGQRTIAVRVTSTCFKSVGSLNDEDAHTENLESLEKLKQTLKSIYPNIGNRSFVTVIHFERLWNEKNKYSSERA